MKNFSLLKPKNVSEAHTNLMEEDSVILAGGTDLLSILKNKILPDYPKHIVCLSGIDELKSIEEREDGLHIGAMVTLSDIATSKVIKRNWSAVADAAVSVASPIIRNTATIGGNICQDIRCWYYRYPHAIGGRINCIRKKGNTCPARVGDNRYHSIFGPARLKEAACTLSCGVHSDIRELLHLIRNDNIDAACRLLLKKNPFPSITARLCPGYCMKSCVKGKNDVPVDMKKVERYLGDYILENKKQYAFSKEVLKGTISIVGTGILSLSLAYYLRINGYTVKYHIDNYHTNSKEECLVPFGQTDMSDILLEVIQNTITFLKNTGIDFINMKLRTIESMLQDLSDEVENNLFVIEKQENEFLTCNGFYLKDSTEEIKIWTKGNAIVIEILTGDPAKVKGTAVANAITKGRSIALTLMKIREIEQADSGVIVADLEKEHKEHKEAFTEHILDTPMTGNSMGIDKGRKEYIQKQAEQCLNCGCYAVNCSDMANVLLACNASIKTNLRTIIASEFFVTNPCLNRFLKSGEFVTHIILPYSKPDMITKYYKYRIRKTIDFAVFAIACSYRMEEDKIAECRIVFGSVAPIPMEAKTAQKYLNGKILTEQTVKRAAELAFSNAVPMKRNKYKIQMAKVAFCRLFGY